MNHLMTRFGVVFAATLLLSVAPGSAFAGEANGSGTRQQLAHGDEQAEAPELAEPFFTKKSFLEKEIEFEVDFADKDTEKETETAIGLSWAFAERLQLGVEVPYVFRDPDTGSDETDLGDISFSAKYLFTDPIKDLSKNRFILSLHTEVAAPTGNEDKDIDEKGKWGVFATAGYVIPHSGAVPELGLHLQFGFEQQIRLTKEQEETAETNGVAAVHQQDVIWRMAATAKLEEGRFVPVLEILGTTTVDAIGEEGTVVELGGGLWWQPFEGGALEPLSIGLAAKGPLTNREDSNYSVLLVVKYDFE